MRNPVRRLKEILGELLLNGQQARLDAVRMLDRIDALERRLDMEAQHVSSMEADLRGIAGDVQRLAVIERDLHSVVADSQRLAIIERDLHSVAAESQRLAIIESALHSAAADALRLRAIEQGLVAAAGQVERLASGFEKLKEKVTGVPAVDPRRVHFGLDELDRKLAAHLDFDNGYFVELGANDGVSQSNTLHFEKFRGWTGVLVEPTPHNFLRCRANRSPRTRTVCCACTAFDYPDRFVEVAFSNLMSTPLGLDSDIRDPIAHAEEGRRFLGPTDDIFTFGARARPLNDVLIEAGAPPAIDLLSLDVEGAELEVLKGIDHGRFRFRFICVECRNIERMTAYLGAEGYELVEKLSHHDYLFRDARPPR